MAKKSQGLSVEEMKIVLKKLAQFHAASAVHYENNGPYEEKFSRGVYNAGMKDVFDEHFEFNFTLVVDNFISKWPNLDKRIVDKMVRARVLKPADHPLTCDFIYRTNGALVFWLSSSGR